MAFFSRRLLPLVCLALLLRGSLSIPISLRANAANPTNSGKHTAVSPRIPSSSKKQTRSNAPDKASVSGTAPFVIKETYRQETPSQSEKGIVGVDLLIEPKHYPVVQRVFSGTPAQRSGIRPGDVILAINGRRVFDKSLWEVDAMISDQPGEQVDFTLLRGEGTRKISVRVESMGSLSASQKQPFMLPWITPE